MTSEGRAGAGEAVTQACLLYVAHALLWRSPGWLNLVMSYTPFFSTTQQLARDACLATTLRLMGAAAAGVGWQNNIRSSYPVRWLLAAFRGLVGKHRCGGVGGGALAHKLVCGGVAFSRELAGWYSGRVARAAPAARQGRDQLTASEHLRGVSPPLQRHSLTSVHKRSADQEQEREDSENTLCHGRHLVVAEAVLCLRHGGGKV